MIDNSVNKSGDENKEIYNKGTYLTMNISIYAMTLLFVIGISALSFKYFEGWFLA